MELAVTDTGCGMDEETQSHLFEPFYTTKEVGQGTGLGLSTVYGIIKQHNGYILVESKPQEGSRFRIFLPRVDKRAEQRSFPELERIAPAGSETILLVEDEDSVRTLVERMLKKLGYRTFSAAGPAQARAIFEQQSNDIDILLTDVRMPGQNGFELYRELVERKPALGVVFMSGYSESALAGIPQTLPRGSSIQKPFRSAQLAVKIREALSEEA